MPCAALCNRLPCNLRCPKEMPCGHQCPGLCGETCPENYCQACSSMKDSRVDLVEMKLYGEIDLNETPIVVLSCGHFFTAETLDGHMGMSDVYMQDRCGGFTRLRGITNIIALSGPRCPDCQSPVRQYCVQRYNRVLNRAVIDEMSKRFLVSGKDELQCLKRKIIDLEHNLEKSRTDIISSIKQAAAHYTGRLTAAKTSAVNQQLRDRYARSKKLEKEIKSFCRSVSDRNQPVRKLHDATVTATRRRSIDSLVADLQVTDSVPAIPRDCQVTLGGRATQLQAECMTLIDSYSIAHVLGSKPDASSVRLPGDHDRLAEPFFKNCVVLVEECHVDNLPRLGVEVSLYYAKIALLYQSDCRSTNTAVERASDYVKTAKQLLDRADELCAQPFENVESLRSAVEVSRKQLGREWYEIVTAEELSTVKMAMISGSGGIATHSGHWYNCGNGHPVSEVFSVRRYSLY